jgi:hypothetical protein
MGVHACKHCGRFDKKWKFQSEVFLGIEARKGLSISDKLSNFTRNPNQDTKQSNAYTSSHWTHFWTKASSAFFLQCSKLLHFITATNSHHIAEESLKFQALRLEMN